MQIKHLQDRYNQLQQALIKNNEQQQNQSQAQAFGGVGHNMQFMANMNSNNSMQYMQPQDAAKNSTTHQDVFK